MIFIQEQLSMSDNIHVSLVTIAVSLDQSNNIILTHKEDIRRRK